MCRGDAEREEEQGGFKRREEDGGGELAVFQHLTDSRQLILKLRIAKSNYYFLGQSAICQSVGLRGKVRQTAAIL